MARDPAGKYRGLDPSSVWSKLMSIDPNSPSGSGPPRASRAVLHVDDDIVVTRMVEQQLGAAGYHCISVNDSTIAFEKLLSSQARVVLLDVLMPGKSGLELLDEIKAHDGGIQVILLTGQVDLTTTMHAMRHGAEACFFKPLRDVRPLLESLEQTFRKIDRWWRALEDLHGRRRALSTV
jgi:DNA-binding NtrC family response regulator